MSPRAARSVAVPAPRMVVATRADNVVWLFSTRPASTGRTPAFLLLGAISLGFWASAAHFIGLY